MSVLEKTESVCPECFKEGKINRISAVAVDEGSKVFLLKECVKHGKFREIYWDDVRLYKRAMKYFATGRGVSNPGVKGADCPNDCGLCTRHKSQSVLTNLIVTNRCNLRCSYCFANAGAAGYVYEPSIKEIEKMLLQIRNERPVPGKALQVTGGEPTIRDDLIDIIKLSKKVGFTHVQLNTNAVRIADEPELAKKYKAAGVNTVYMSFDGFKKNPWLETNLRAIETLRKANLGIVLVPTVIKTKNDDELGDIIRFAAKNIDIVRGVNFQPVSFVGRIDKLPEEVRNRERITYSEMIMKVEQQLPSVKTKDWYPVPFMLPVSRLAENLKGGPQVEFTCHSSCGGATYVFVDNDNIIPITRIVDVEALMKFIDEKSKIKGRLKKARIAASFLKNINKFVNKEKAPKDFELRKLLVNALMGGSYESLRKFHHKSLYIGSMWFQDVWNMHIGRLERCVIHYTTPEGIIPFCAYNGLGYGQKIEKKYGLPVKEWEKRNKKAMVNDLWKGGPVS